MKRQETHRSDWRPLEGVTLRQLVGARVQAHYAIQWLARIARAYIPPQPDDSHTSLLWDRKLDAFVTQSLKTRIYFSVRIPDLVLSLHDVSSSLEIIRLAGHSDLEIREWLGKELSARGFDAEALDAPSPYELPAHPMRVGHWHTHEFTAAVLTWDNVLSSNEQKAVARDFLHGAVVAALKILADSGV